MTLVTDIRRTVTDNTAVYVAVGITDLAVEKVRDARERAAAARAGFSVTGLPARVAGQAQQVPTLAFNRTLEIAGQAQESYDDLAERGEKLVKRLRTQKATQGPDRPGRDHRPPRPAAPSPRPARPPPRPSAPPARR